MTDKSKPEEFFAWVDDGGLITAVIPESGAVLPLVTNSRKLLLTMESIARQHAVVHSKPVSLIRYRLAEVVKTIEPGGKA